MEVGFAYQSVSIGLMQRRSTSRNGANESNIPMPRGKLIGSSEINILGMPAVPNTFINFV